MSQDEMKQTFCQLLRKISEISSEGEGARKRLIGPEAQTDTETQRHRDRHTQTMTHRQSESESE